MIGAVEPAARGRLPWLVEATLRWHRAENRSAGPVGVVAELRSVGAQQGEGQWRQQLRDAAQSRGRLVEFPVRDARAVSCTSNARCNCSSSPMKTGCWPPAGCRWPRRSRLTAGIDPLAVRPALAAIAADGAARCVNLALASLQDASFRRSCELVLVAPQAARSPLLDLSGRPPSTSSLLVPKWAGTVGRWACAWAGACWRRAGPGGPAPSRPGSTT